MNLRLEKSKSITSKKFELETEKNEIADQLNEEKNNEEQFEKIKEAVDYNNKEEAKIKPYEDMLAKKQAELKKIKQKLKQNREKTEISGKQKQNQVKLPTYNSISNISSKSYRTSFINRKERYCNKNLWCSNFNNGRQLAHF